MTRKRSHGRGRGGSGSGGNSRPNQVQILEQHFMEMLQETAEEKMPREELRIQLYETWIEYLEEHKDMFRQGVVNQIERKLKRLKTAIPLDYYHDEDDEDDRQRDRDRRDRRRRRRMVDAGNYGSFIRSLMSDKNYQEDFLCWLMGVKSPSVWQYDYILRWNKEHHGSKTDWDSLFGAQEINYSEVFADAVDEVFGRYLRDFYPLKPNRKAFEAALNESPMYSGVSEKAEIQRREERRVSEALVQSIPDDYTELFPLAREMKRHFVLHVGGTNSGKTYQAMEALKRAETGVYLAPLRLLAYEKFEELNTAGYPCSMITGEEEIEIPCSKLQSCTVDVLSYLKKYDCAVIDECQMLAEPERGGRWTNAILGVCADEVHLCLAPHAEKAVLRLIEACGDTYEIQYHERKTPLIVEDENFDLNRTRPGDALIVFSKKDVHAVAAELRTLGVQASVIYGALPYSVRQNEAARFRNGETKVVVATDAIGMGMNLPIQRVVFLNTEKFDGIAKRPLEAQEFQQIAGRAGRFGIYDKGLVNVQGMRKKALRHKLAEQVPDIQVVRISFSESLKGIDAPLSTIFARWNSLEPREGFLYTNMERERKLALELERKTENKELIYAFATMAFDEEDLQLKALWMSCFECFLAGHDLPVNDMIQGCLAVNDDMNTLEQSFRQMDVLYQCQRLKDRESTELRLIVGCKEQISDRIIALLQEQKLMKRTCKRCGEEIPWNYKYGICQKCFNKQHGRRGDYGWG